MQPFSNTVNVILRKTNTWHRIGLRPEFLVPAQRWRRALLRLGEAWKSCLQFYRIKLKLRSTILDGEVVAVDENGIPRFQLLQRFQKQPTAPTKIEARLPLLPRQLLLKKSVILAV